MAFELFGSDHDLPVSFYFSVSVAGTIPAIDTAFKEVSGIGSEIDIETVSEGGENRFQHKLPKQVKQQNLVLKRGISTLASPWVIWCKATLEADYILPIQTQVVNVSLMNHMKIPIRTWVFDRAYPVKWTVDGFDGMKNEIAIETMEIAYHASMRMF